MRIIFLTISKFKNIEDHGLYTDLLRFFRDQGHEIFIVSSIEKRENSITSLNVSKNCHHLKVQIGNITKTNFIEKGFSTLSIDYLYSKAIKKYFSNIKFDLILYSTPPITFIKTIQRLKKDSNATTYLMLKDIFPQNAVDLGLMSNNGFLQKYFRKKEIALYNLSDIIGTMSPRNKSYILENNDIDEDKVEILPNTITPGMVNIDFQEIVSVRKKYELPLDKKNFIYGGNLGKPQGIDFIIDCLKLNETNDKSYILIVGSGTEFNKLEEAFQVNNFRNARLLSQLAKTEYEKLVRACDVGLIFLDYRFTIPNFPSRLLSYMQASLPVIAATDPNTDIGEIIESNNFGRKILSNDPHAFNFAIQEFSNKNDLKEMGLNSRKLLEREYTTTTAYNTIIKYFGKGD